MGADLAEEPGVFVGEVEEGLVGEQELHVLLQRRRVLPPALRI